MTKKPAAKKKSTKPKNESKGSFIAPSNVMPPPPPPKQKFDTMSVSELPADPLNPNVMEDADKERMKKSLAKWGDLSGVVLSRKTGLLCGGHQRVSVMQEGKVVITERFNPPLKDGTVARGYIDHNDLRYSYRETNWDSDESHGAMLAANQFSRAGHWDMDLVGTLMKELDGKFDLDLTGFDEAARKDMFKDDSVGSGEGGDEKDQHQIKCTAAQWEIIQCAIKRVRTREGNESISDGRALELVCGTYLAEPEQG